MAVFNTQYILKGSPSKGHLASFAALHDARSICSYLFALSAVLACKFKTLGRIRCYTLGCMSLAALHPERYHRTRIRFTNFILLGSRGDR